MRRRSKEMRLPQYPRAQTLAFPANISRRRWSLLQNFPVIRRLRPNNKKKKNRKRKNKSFVILIFVGPYAVRSTPSFLDPDPAFFRLSSLSLLSLSLSRKQKTRFGREKAYRFRNPDIPRIGYIWIRRFHLTRWYIFSYQIPSLIS